MSTQQFESKLQLDRDVVEQIKQAATEWCGADGVRAIFVVGSHATGNADRHSDVDVQVIHRFDWWQKMNVQLGGVEIDVVLAPLEYYREALGRLHEVLAGMLVDAVPIDDREGIVTSLQEGAGRALRIRAEFADRKNPFDHLVRHRPVTLLHDAEDMFDLGDTDGVTFLTSSAVAYALQTFVTRRYRRADVKQSYRTIASNEPNIYALLQEFHRMDLPKDRVRAAYRVCEAQDEDLGGLTGCGSSERVPWRQALMWFGG